MSSGYVTTNIPRPVEKKRKSSRLGVAVKAVPYPGVNGPGGTPITGFSVNDLLFANPVTSWRSGPSFDREMKKPGAILGEASYSEVLNSERGDTGHEFSMGKVVEFYGDTSSHRPATGWSTAWNQFGRPLPTLVGSPYEVTSDDVRSDVLLDRDWSFRKTDSDLVTLGTSFIRSTNPIQSQVNLLSSIAEAVTDGSLLPELIGKQIVSSAIDPRKRRGLIRAAGGEYLNYIFGYKPLADDIAKVGVLIDTVNTYVDQWIKDNGTIVRRRRKITGDFSYPDSRSIGYRWDGVGATSPSVSSYMPYIGKNDKGMPAISSYGVGAPSSAERAKVETRGLVSVRVDREITFSAGYEYDFTRLYLPTGGSAADLMHNHALRNDLTAIAFGLDPSSIFTAAYDATPFSWLLDWFVNIGDIIDNFRGLQARGVQMLWGYIAETALRTAYYEVRHTYLPNGDVFFHTNGSSVQKTIRRIRATPFGFGLSYAGLTNSQQTTLAALVAAKSPGKTPR